MTICRDCNSIRGCFILSDLPFSSGRFLVGGVVNTAAASAAASAVASAVASAATGCDATAATAADAAVAAAGDGIGSSISPGIVGSTLICSMAGYSWICGNGTLPLPHLSH